MDLWRGGEGTAQSFFPLLYHSAKSRPRRCRKKISRRKQRAQHAGAYVQARDGEGLVDLVLDRFDGLGLLVVRSGVFIGAKGPTGGSRDIVEVDE